MKMTYASTKKNAVSTLSTVPPSDAAKLRMFAGSRTDAAASAPCLIEPEGLHPGDDRLRGRLELIAVVDDEVRELDAGEGQQEREEREDEVRHDDDGGRRRPSRPAARSSGCRTGWQMMTITAPSTSGPTRSRANERPASAITAAARPMSTRSVGDSAGDAGGAGAGDCLTPPGYPRPPDTREGAPTTAGGHSASCSASHSFATRLGAFSSHASVTTSRSCSRSIASSRTSTAG